MLISEKRANQPFLKEKKIVKGEESGDRVWPHLGLVQGPSCPGTWGRWLVPGVAPAGCRAWGSPLGPHVFPVSLFLSSLSGSLVTAGGNAFSHREDTQEIGPSDIYKSDLIPALGSLPAPAGPRSCANSLGFWRAGLAQFPASRRPLTLHTRPVERANSG